MVYNWLMFGVSASSVEVVRYCFFLGCCCCFTLSYIKDYAYADLVSTPPSHTNRKHCIVSYLRVFSKTRKIDESDSPLPPLPPRGHMAWHVQTMDTYMYLSWSTYNLGPRHNLRSKSTKMRIPCKKKCCLPFSFVFFFGENRKPSFFAVGEKNTLGPIFFSWGQFIFEGRGSCSWHEAEVTARNRRKICVFSIFRRKHAPSCDTKFRIPY